MAIGDVNSVGASYGVGYTLGANDYSADWGVHAGTDTGTVTHAETTTTTDLRTGKISSSATTGTENLVKTYAGKVVVNDAVGAPITINIAGQNYSAVEWASIGASDGSVHSIGNSTTVTNSTPTNLQTVTSFSGGNTSMGITTTYGGSITHTATGIGGSASEHLEYIYTPAP